MKKLTGRGGPGRGQGRKRDTFNPWSRIFIAERFYEKHRELRLSLRRAVTNYEIALELYADDYPDKITITNKPTTNGLIVVRDVLKKHEEHFRLYQQRIVKLARRGANEEQAMIEGHWEEWFRRHRQC